MSTDEMSTVVSSDVRRYTIVNLKQVNEIPLRNALQSFDKNGDGKIDISELQKIVYWYGLWKYASIGLCLIVLTLVWATFGLTVWAIDLTKDYTVTDGVLTGGDEVVKTSIASTYIPLSWATLLDRRHLDSLESLSIDVTHGSGKFSAGMYHMKVASYLHANSSYLKLVSEDGSRVWVNSGTVVLHHPDADEAIMVCGAAACNTLAVDVRPEYLQQLVQRSAALFQSNRDFQLPSAVDGVAISKASGQGATCMATATPKLCKWTKRAESTGTGGADNLHQTTEGCSSYDLKPATAPVSTKRVFEKSFWDLPADRRRLEADAIKTFSENSKFNSNAASIYSQFGKNANGGAINVAFPPTDPELMEAWEIMKQGGRRRLAEHDEGQAYNAVLQTGSDKNTIFGYVTARHAGLSDSAISSAAGVKDTARIFPEKMGEKTSAEMKAQFDAVIPRRRLESVKELSRLRITGSDRNAIQAPAAQKAAFAAAPKMPEKKVAGRNAAVTSWSSDLPVPLRRLEDGDTAYGYISEADITGTVASGIGEIKDAMNAVHNDVKMAEKVLAERDAQLDNNYRRRLMKNTVPAAIEGINKAEIMDVKDEGYHGGEVEDTFRAASKKAENVNEELQAKINKFRRRLQYDTVKDAVGGFIDSRIAGLDQNKSSFLREVEETTSIRDEDEKNPVLPAFLKSEDADSDRRRLGGISWQGFTSGAKDLARTVFTGADHNDIDETEEEENTSAVPEKPENVDEDREEAIASENIERRRLMKVEDTDSLSLTNMVASGYDITKSAKAAFNELNSEKKRKDVENVLKTNGLLEDGSSRRRLQIDSDEFEKLEDGLKLNLVVHGDWADFDAYMFDLRDGNPQAFEALFKHYAPRRRLVPDVDAGKVELFTINNKGFAAGVKAAKNAVEAAAAEAQKYEGHFVDFTNPSRRLQKPAFTKLHNNGDRLSDDDLRDAFQAVDLATRGDLEVAFDKNKLTRRRLDGEMPEFDLNLSDMGIGEAAAAVADNAAQAVTDAVDPDHVATHDSPIRRRLNDVVGVINSIDFDPNDSGSQAGDSSGAATTGDETTDPNSTTAWEGGYERRRLGAVNGVFKNVKEVDVNPSSFGKWAAAAKGSAQAAAAKVDEELEELLAMETSGRRRLGELDNIVNKWTAVGTSPNEKARQVKDFAGSMKEFAKENEELTEVVGSFMKGKSPRRLQEDEPLVQTERRRLGSLPNVDITTIVNMGYGAGEATDEAFTFFDDDAATNPGLLSTDEDYQVQADLTRRRFQDESPIQTERRRLEASKPFELVSGSRFMGPDKQGIVGQIAKGTALHAELMEEKANQGVKSKDSDFHVTNDLSARRRFQDESLTQTERRRLNGVGNVQLTNSNPNGINSSFQAELMNEANTSTDDGVSEALNGMLNQVSEAMTSGRRRLDANVVGHLDGTSTIRIQDNGHDIIPQKAGYDTALSLDNVGSGNEELDVEINHTDGEFRLGSGAYDPESSGIREIGDRRRLMSPDLMIAFKKLDESDKTNANNNFNKIPVAAQAQAAQTSAAGGTVNGIAAMATMDTVVSQFPRRRLGELKNHVQDAQGASKTNSNSNFDFIPVTVQNAAIAAGNAQRKVSDAVEKMATSFDADRRRLEAISKKVEEFDGLSWSSLHGLDEVADDMLEGELSTTGGLYKTSKKFNEMIDGFTADEPGSRRRLQIIDTSVLDTFAAAATQPLNDNLGIEITDADQETLSELSQLGEIAAAEAFDNLLGGDEDRRRLMYIPSKVTTDGLADAVKGGQADKSGISNLAAAAQTNQVSAPGSQLKKSAANKKITNDSSMLPGRRRMETELLGYLDKAVTGTEDKYGISHNTFAHSDSAAQMSAPGGTSEAKAANDEKNKVVTSEKFDPRRRLVDVKKTAGKVGSTALFTPVDNMPKNLPTPNQHASASSAAGGTQKVSAGVLNHAKTFNRRRLTSSLEGNIEGFASSVTPILNNNPIGSLTDEQAGANSEAGAENVNAAEGAMEGGFDRRRLADIVEDVKGVKARLDYGGIGFIPQKDLSQAQVGGGMFQKDTALEDNVTTANGMRTVGGDGRRRLSNASAFTAGFEMVGGADIMNTVSHGKALKDDQNGKFMEAGAPAKPAPKLESGSGSNNSYRTKNGTPRRRLGASASDIIDYMSNTDITTIDESAIRDSTIDYGGMEIESDDTEKVNEELNASIMPGWRVSTDDLKRRRLAKPNIQDVTSLGWTNMYEGGIASGIEEAKMEAMADAFDENVREFDGEIRNYIDHNQESRRRLSGTVKATYGNLASAATGLVNNGFVRGIQVAQNYGISVNGMPISYVHQSDADGDYRTDEDKTDRRRLAGSTMSEVKDAHKDLASVSIGMISNGIEYGIQEGQNIGHALPGMVGEGTAKVEEAIGGYKRRLMTIDELANVSANSNESGVGAGLQASENNAAESEDSGTGPDGVDAVVSNF